MNIFSVIWEFVNTPFAISIIAAGVLWLLSRSSRIQPLWKRWEGTIITAVKFAEKAIPNNTPNKGLEKLDYALKYVLRVYESMHGVPANVKTTAALKEGVQIIHNELEAKRTI